MSASTNVAAWSLEAKGGLVVKEAPMYTVDDDEILIENHAVAIQPFDARIRRDAYIPVPYPFILGNGVAGIVAAVGPAVTQFKKGDRVISDTAVYKKRLTKQGAWQRYVVGQAGWTVNIGKAGFEGAIAIPFALQTAVSALHVYLGMELPGQRVATAPEEKVLIWGAGGAVGGYAVQYAKSVGYTVVATGSPRSAAHLESIGASSVLDYKSPTIMQDLRSLGPFKFLFTTSGDLASQKALGELLQPEGGKFASTLQGEVDLPKNVERIYDSFSATTQKEGPKFDKFRQWWYEDYLPRVINEHIIEATAFEKRAGGLQAIEKAADDVLAGRAKAKLILNPQE